MTTRSAGSPSPKPDATRPPDAEDAGRAGRQRLDRPGERQPPASTAARTSPIAVSMPLIPFAAQPELDVLVDLGVRRVVGGDRVGRAVDAAPRGRPRASSRGPERRVDAQRGVERRRRRSRRPPTGRARAASSSASHAQRREPAIHSSVSARWWGVTSQVTGRPAAFAAPDVRERRRRSRRGSGGGGRRARRATTSARIAIVAGDRRRLGRRRPAAQAEHGRDDALVRLGALGQRRILRVVDDRQPERARVGERVAEQRRRADRRAVVARSRRRRRRPARRARRASRPRGPR